MPATIPSPVLIGFASFEGWSSTEGADGARVLVSPEIDAAVPWNELIASWNVEPATDSGLTTEVAVEDGGGWSRWYSLGDWSLDGRTPVVRASVGGQKDERGAVKTDTLVLRRPVRRLRLRLKLRGGVARHAERLRLVTVSLTDTSGGKEGTESRPPCRQAWGVSLDVPRRSQLSHAEGESWCSPTSVSMVLGWWAKRLNRPELDRTVPEVAEAVNDPAWPGTGNWPFNTAYVGSFAGLLACAARLRDLRDLEELIAAGIPVVMSVYPPALRGREAVVPNSGHLIVCTGFTPEGDMRANDPYARLGQGQVVERVYGRANVERAWAHAHRLAYLILPWSEKRRLPAVWR